MGGITGEVGVNRKWSRTKRHTVPRQCESVREGPVTRIKQGENEGSQRRRGGGYDAGKECKEGSKGGLLPQDFSHSVDRGGGGMDRTSCGTTKKVGTGSCSGGTTQGWLTLAKSYGWEGRGMGGGGSWSGRNSRGKKGDHRKVQATPVHWSRGHQMDVVPGGRWGRSALEKKCQKLSHSSSLLGGGEFSSAWACDVFAKDNYHVSKSSSWKGKKKLTGRSYGVHRERLTAACESSGRRGHKVRELLGGLKMKEG